MENPLRETREIRSRRRRRGVRVQAYDVVLRCFAETVGADSALLLGHRAGLDEDEVLASWAQQRGRLPAAWNGDSLLGRALGADRPLFDLAESGVDPGSIAAVAAPIPARGRALGVIYAGFSQPSAEAVDDIGRTAESYARMAGLCMGEDLTLAAVLGSVGFDVLTGCLSYSGVVEVLKAEIERSRRSGHLVSCCFIDLDNFKRVNDERGHLEGNRVLQATGRALQRTARSYDAIGRFGGDEFIVILPETGIAAGTSISARYRAAVLSSVAESSDVAIDLSVGIAEWDGSASATQLLALADAALARAKEAGGSALSSTAGRRIEGVLELTQELIGWGARAAAVHADGDGHLDGNGRADGDGHADGAKAIP